MKIRFYLWTLYIYTFIVPILVCQILSFGVFKNMQTYLNNKEIILIALCYYIYYLCMSKKSTRSNILFIASDDSDHDSSGQ